jgi:hypothetical protein
MFEDLFIFNLIHILQNLHISKHVTHWFVQFLWFYIAIKINLIKKEIIQIHFNCFYFISP